MSFGLMIVTGGCSCRDFLFRDRFTLSSWNAVFHSY